MEPCAGLPRGGPGARDVCPLLLGYSLAWAVGVGMVGRVQQVGLVWGCRDVLGCWQHIREGGAAVMVGQAGPNGGTLVLLACD